MQVPQEIHAASETNRASADPVPDYFRVQCQVTSEQLGFLLESVSNIGEQFTNGPLPSSGEQASAPLHKEGAVNELWSDDFGDLYSSSTSRDAMAKLFSL